MTPSRRTAQPTRLTLFVPAAIRGGPSQFGAMDSVVVVIASPGEFVDLVL